MNDRAHGVWCRIGDFGYSKATSFARCNCGPKVELTLPPQSSWSEQLAHSKWFEPVFTGCRIDLWRHCADSGIIISSLV